MKKKVETLHSWYYIKIITVLNIHRCPIPWIVQFFWLIIACSCIAWFKDSVLCAIYSLEVMNNLIHQDSDGDESDGPISHPITDNLQRRILKPNNYMVRTLCFLIIFYLGKAPGAHPRVDAISRHSYFYNINISRIKWFNKMDDKM